MLAQVILQGQGPLPLKGQFEFEATEAANILVSASAYSASPNQTIGLALSIDGKMVAGASAYTNEAQSHKALVSALSEVNPGFGRHQVVLDVARPGTVTDANDYFTVTLIY